MNTFVMKIEYPDEKTKVQALKTVIGFPGICSISIDDKEKKVTVTGHGIDPVRVVEKVNKHCVANCKVNKHCVANLISFCPVKKDDKEKKQDSPPPPNVCCPPYPPYCYYRMPPPPPYGYKVVDECPDMGCVIL